MAAERGPARPARSNSGRRSATNRSWPTISSYSWPPLEMYWSSNELRLARLRRTQHRRHHFVVDRRELGATARKESRDHRKSVRDRRRRRRVQHQRRVSPVSRLTRTADAPWPRTAHSSSHRCCLTSGISVCTASSMSASVQGPGPARHAGQDPRGRFWYIRPRVPSIGSTMIDPPRASRGPRLRAARLRRRAGPRRPAAPAHPRGDRPLDLLDEHVFGDAVDRVDRVALLVVRDADSAVTAARSHASTTSLRMRRCSA